MLVTLEGLGRIHSQPIICQGCRLAGNDLQHLDGQPIADCQHGYWVRRDAYFTRVAFAGPVEVRLLDSTSVATEYLGRFPAAELCGATLRAGEAILATLGDGVWQCPLLSQLGWSQVVLTGE